MRKLASIKMISDIRPIPGKDRIALAAVDGWSVIVQKADYSVGDLCVFCEIDSVLPERPEFEFLRSKGFRIKTMKMAGVLSQGICFPLSILPPGDYQPEQDVTKLMGVTQYEPTQDKDPEPRAGRKKYPRWLMRMGWFRSLVLSKPKKTGYPSFISKTDETRLQTAPYVLENKQEWVATEKVDGCLTGEADIITDQGLLKICKIVTNKLNVNVLTYNEERKCCEFKPVTDWHKIVNTRPHYRIGVAFRGHGNRPKFIECTDNHRFLTANGWKRADELSLNDKLCHYSKRYPSELDEMILGCMLGDSYLNSNTKDGAYRTLNISHGDTQSSYYEYKKQLLGKLFIDQGTRISGYGSVIRHGCVVSNLQTRELLLRYFNPAGRKHVSKELAQAITPISVAFWYMDDGSISNRDNPNMRCRARLNTQRYSYEENKILSDALYQKFNIYSTIGDASKYKGYVLIFDADNTDKLCTLIAPYVCSNMKYKLPVKYENMPCVFENFSMDYSEGVVETDILSIENVGTTTDKYVFDLEVADNHNYFAKNILVHNCSATYALLRHRRPWPLRDRFEYIVCSRNLRLRVKDNSSYWIVSDKYRIEQALRNMIGRRDWVAIQGECVGPKIQGNKYKLNDYRLYVFNLIYSDSGRKGSMLAKSVAENHGLEFVPVVDTRYVLPDTMDDALKDATAQSAINPDTLREGLVIRSQDGRQSWKIVSPEFLIYYNE